MYQRNLQGEDRTNNLAEVENKRLRGELGMLHPPTMWNLLHALKSKVNESKRDGINISRKFQLCMIERQIKLLNTEKQIKEF